MMGAQMYRLLCHSIIATAFFAVAVGKCEFEVFLFVRKTVRAMILTREHIYVLYLY